MNITIPDEALEAAAIVLMSRLMVSQQDALHVWSGMYEPEKEQFRREARAACLAMIRAWPGMLTGANAVGTKQGGGTGYATDAIALPMPLKETRA